MVKSRRSTEKREEFEQSDESTAELEDEAPSKEAKRPKLSSIDANSSPAQSEDEALSKETKHSSKRKKIKKREAEKQEKYKTLEIETIVSYVNSHGTRKYRLKLKDGSTTWQSSQKLKTFYPDVLRKYKEDLENEVAVEAIISHKYDKNHGRKFLIKWKDHSKGETWEPSKKAILFCPKMVKAYNEEVEKEEAKAFEVEAIISHKYNKSHGRKYLIKWKDHSKGETWETPKKAASYCSNMLSAYNEEVEQAEAKALEVKDILSHKLVWGESKYLIKWKDKSKGETWETARRTITVCPDILDKFTKKNPDCIPIIYNVGHQYKSRAISPATARKQKAAAEEFDESEDWEVGQILDVQVKANNKTREFLIHWEGYGSEYDSWEPEQNLDCTDLIEKFMTKRGQEEGAKAKSAKSKNAKKEKRRKPKQTDPLANEITIKKESKDSRLSKRRRGK